MKRSKTTNNRVVILFILICVIIGIISCNVFFTTLTGYHLRSMTSVLEAKQGSQEKTEVLTAKRGYIKDRDGEVIAQDQDTYTIVAILYEGRLGDYSYVMDRAFTAKCLAPYLEMSEEEVMSYLDQQDQGLYQTYFGENGKGLTVEEKNEIESIIYTPDPDKKTPGLPGIEFEKTFTRVYTPGKFTSTLLGFARYDSELQRTVGQIGLEAYLDEELTGKDGYQTYQKDAFGYKIPGSEQAIEYAQNGKDVYLTIDKDVQSALESALQSSLIINGSQQAWGVIMEVETGKILAYAGYPTYDLNTREDVIYTDIPSMYNFEPGSVMKPFVYASAIETGVYKAEDTVSTGRFCVAYDDNGKIYRGDGPCAEEGNINDATREGWGDITFDEGLIRSSNTAIATLLTEYLEDDVFWDYLDKFGFFKQTGTEGLTMSEEMGIKNDIWPIDRIAAGFGQGSAVTTLQLMQAYTAIFNDGYMVKPYYIDKIVNPSTQEVEYYGKTEYLYTDAEGNPKQILKSSTTDKVIELMREIAQNEEMGTGRRYNIEGIDMIAKTGTGEIATTDGYGKVSYTSSIMAAAPAADPKIMMYYAFQGENYLNYSTEFFKSAFMTAYDSLNLSKNQQETIVDNTYEVYETYTMPQIMNHTSVYANWKIDEMNVRRIIIGDGDQVIDQYPSANELVQTNQNVFLLTNGLNITMPNMTGWTYKDVLVFKQLTGLNIRIEGYGTVFSQNIVEGSPVYMDQEIIIKMY